MCYLFFVYFCLLICYYQSLPVKQSAFTQHDFLLLINVGYTNLLEFSPFAMETTGSAWKEEHMTCEIQLLIQPSLGRKIVIQRKGS